MGGLRNLIGENFAGACLRRLLAGGPAAAKETVLTEDSVSRFLASFGEMRDIAIAEGLKTGTDSEAAKNPLGAVLKAIKSSKLKARCRKDRQSSRLCGFERLGRDRKGGGAGLPLHHRGSGAGHRQGYAGAEQESSHQASLKKLGLLNADSKQKLTENLDKLRMSFRASLRPRTSPS